MAGPEGLLFASGGAATEGIIKVDGLTSGPQFDEFDLKSGAAYLTGGSSELDLVVDDAPTVRTVDEGKPWWLGSAAAPRRQGYVDWTRRYVGRDRIIDALIGALAAVLPASMSETLSQPPSTLILLGVFGAIIWPVAIGMARGYQRSLVGVGSDELRAVLRAAAAIVVACAFPAGLFSQDALLKLVVVATPLALALSLTMRYVARKILHRQQRLGQNVRKVVVVGSSSAAQQLRERLENEPHCGMKVIGVCLPESDLHSAGVPGMPVLGSLYDVADVVRRVECDAVAVTTDDATRNNYLRSLSWSLEGTGVEMLVDPGLVEVAGPRMHIRPLVGFPLLHVEEPHFTGWRRLFKRTSDVVLTLVGLVVISPLLLGIAAAIKLQDRGPILFKQRRVGRGGQEFWMYKFRSMVIDAEARKAELMSRNEGKGGLFKLGDDPRITPLGRFLRDFSLDELPQLFNVLNGTHVAGRAATAPGPRTGPDAQRSQSSGTRDARSHRPVAGQRAVRSRR